MSESIEEIAKQEDPKERIKTAFKILPYIMGSKPTSANLFKVNR